MRVPVVIDGFISGAAAAIAVGAGARSDPTSSLRTRSVEIGHTAIFELGNAALFDFDLRLGEGTGAVLAFHIIEAAARILDEMATFGEAGGEWEGAVSGSANQRGRQMTFDALRNTQRVGGVYHE